MADEVRLKPDAQVHHGFELLKSDPPPWSIGVDDFVIAGRLLSRRRRQRRAAGAATVAAAVLGLAVAVPQIIGTGRTQTAAAGPTASTSAAPGLTAGASAEARGSTGETARTGMRVQSKPFTFTLKSYDVGEFHVADPVVAAPDYQRAPVYQDGRTQGLDTAVRHYDLRSSQADLVVYRPGRYEPNGFTARARAVRVGGQLGLQETSTESTMLAWPYADDAWATLETVSGAQQDIVTALPSIAEGLAGEVEAPARTPMALSYLPTGYHLVEVGVHGQTGPQTDTAASDPGTVAELRFARATPSGAALALDEVDADELQIALVSTESSNLLVSAGSTPTCTGTSVCRLAVSGSGYQLEASGGQLRTEELGRILVNAKVSSVDDPATWTEVTEGIPGVD